MSGTVAVEEVFAGMLPDAPRAMPRAAASEGLDPEAIRALLRRDEARQARLRAD